MRRACLLVAAAALAAAGCGSKTKTTSPTTADQATASTSSTSNPTATPGSPGDCTTLGINPSGRREGTCTHGGITYVIVNRNHVLRLHTLNAHLGKVRVVSTLSGSQPTGAQMKFVIAGVTITNRLSLPQTIDKSGTQQFALILDGTVYKESVAVESSSDPISCHASNPKINPGSTATCDVVFEVPSQSTTDLGRHGRSDLYVVEFGSDLTANPPPQTVGQIRLYQ